MKKRVFGPHFPGFRIYHVHRKIAYVAAGIVSGGKPLVTWQLKRYVLKFWVRIDDFGARVIWRFLPIASSSFDTELPSSRMLTQSQNDFRAVSPESISEHSPVKLDIENETSANLSIIDLLDNGFSDILGVPQVGFETVNKNVVSRIHSLMRCCSALSQERIHCVSPARLLRIFRL